MTLDKIIEVARKYRNILPVYAQECQRNFIILTCSEQLWHCAWMCDQIISGDKHRDKAMRWLCFVQGVLWSQGYMTINHLKNDNKGIEKI